MVTPIEGCCGCDEWMEPAYCLPGGGEIVMRDGVAFIKRVQ